MTEYTISPQAYREFMSARDRTAYWVQTYDPEEVYSPSTAPQNFDGFAPPSPALSTHSLPPKMVLRYNDGRGDIPIPHPAGGPSSRSSHRSQTAYNSHHHSRTASHTSSPLAAAPSTHHRDQDYAHPPTPEEIHILPSRSSHNPSYTTSSSSQSNHNRSKSVPRNVHPQDVPFIAPPVPRSRPSQQSSQPPYSPWISGRGGPSKQPPPIVYAPGHHHGPNYEPPLVLHHPPQMGPNGMIYSHSAPPILGGGSSQYPPHNAPYTNVTRTDGERTGRPMTREYRRPVRGRQTQPLRRKGSSETLSSQGSGSTYYVLPSAGQKVHVIAASPERSIETASSTTKNASSPYSQSSAKKPFFGRLFARFSSPAPSKSAPPNNRKLHRRHSIGAKMNEQR